MDFLSTLTLAAESADKIQETVNATMFNVGDGNGIWYLICLLYTSDAADEL